MSWNEYFCLGTAFQCVKRVVLRKIISDSEICAIQACVDNCFCARFRHRVRQGKRNLFDTHQGQMEGDRVNIEKLEDGSNWLTWKFQMRQILEDAEIFDVVDGTTDKPTLGSAEYGTAIKTWKKADSKARRIISSACKKQAVQIINCETASEMWEMLKATYERTSKANTLYLQQKYYGYAKELGDDVATFLSKLMKIVQQLRDQKEILSDAMVISKILMSLPSEYNHFHSAWESALTIKR